MEKFNGYLVKVYTDRNIYSLTYGDERKDMEYNPTICPTDAPVPPEPEPEKKIPQSIVWEQDFGEFYVGDEIELSAYATSGLPITYRIEDGNRIAHLNGNRLTADAEGGIIVMATQGGNDVYYAADNVLKPINVKEQPQPIVKKEQTIAWNQVIDLHEGEEIVLNATATSGLPVQFTIVEGMENGRLIGNTLYGVNNGNVSVRAYQLGNDEWKEAEPITKPIYIQKKEEPVPPTPEKQDQTINWEQSISIRVGDVISLSATATSGLPIQYVVTLGNELVSINGNELTALGDGPVMIKAEQRGNDYFNAAEPKVKAFTIDKKEEPPVPVKKDQMIVWEQTIEMKVGDVVELNAVATSGLPITYSVAFGAENVTLNENVLTAVADGVVVVMAAQNGNDEYNAAESVTKGITIEKNIPVPTGNSWIRFNVVGYSRTDVSEIMPLDDRESFAWLDDNDTVRQYLRQGINIVNFDTIPANSSKIIHIRDTREWLNVLWVDSVEVYIDDTYVQNLDNLLGGFNITEDGTFTILKWNAPNVRSMEGFMYSAYSSNSNLTIDLTKVYVSNVTNLKSAFNQLGMGTSTHETLVLDEWDIREDCDVTDMFNNAYIGKLYLRRTNERTIRKINEALELSPTHKVLEIITE